MKVLSRSVNIILNLSLLFTIIFPSCKKDENPIKFVYGSFPDSLYNLEGLNSANDDYNVDIQEITGSLFVIFSSNRSSSGGQFDLVQGRISYTFDRTNGNFTIESGLTTDSFLSKLINQAITPGNDFGPYRFFSTGDGNEYLLLSSVNGSGNLDLYYLRNAPAYGSVVPLIEGPKPVNLLNSVSDDAYPCFDANQDSLYFTSDRDGNFDIFIHKMSVEEPLSDQFSRPFINSTKVDLISSTEDDKCPFINRRVLVFASNRLGGLGGYDLYYSVFRQGAWSSPVNFGPTINTSYNEYRPALGSVQDFTNSFLIFSSDRPGGKGGYDLYFTGLQQPE